MVSLEKGELLLRAVQNNNLEKCKELIKIGTDINQKDEYGDTSLMLACIYGYIQICSLLLKNGANVNKNNNYGISALIYASIKGCKEICLLLLKNGANVEKRGPEGDTALICASRYGHKELCSLLLENGADINIKDKYHNNTALRWASTRGYEGICLLLLKSGCNYSSNYERISYIKLSKLIKIVPEEILDDINNKSIGYCSKCQKHFYYYRYELELRSLKKDEIINIKVHCL